MKAKLTLYSSLLALSLLIGFACNKSTIEISPVNPSEADYFQNESEFDKTILGVYAGLTPLFNHNGGTHMAPLYYLPGDDVTLTNEDPFEHFVTLTSGNGVTNGFYQNVYRMIGRANLVLEKIRDEKGVYNNAGLKNNHKGEALFLRAWGYFNLWVYFGKAPVLKERITAVTDLYPAESKGTELLDQAITDLTEAAAALPLSWAAAQRGRVTANGANGMLAKLLVFRGTVNKTAADFTAAIAAINKISGASLVANFGDNFDVNKENNPESLFEFQASTAGGDNVWLPNEFDGAIGTMSAYWGYFYQGNTRSNNNRNYIATNKLIAALPVSDPRYTLTVNPASIGGKQLIKWSKNDLTGGNGQSSANNPRILRYADVLLLKAEALLQSNGSTAEAIGLINTVRTRARNMTPGSTTPANYSTAETNKTTIQNWIMNERFIELAAEGHRWPDLKRWHLAGYITLANTFFDATNTAALGFNAPKNLVFPIPLTELDRNPNISQNEGY
jgi:hypothetical protein